MPINHSQAVTAGHGPSSNVLMVTVLGGTGILGSWVAKAMAAQGHSVRVIGRKASVRPWPDWPQIHGMAADVRNASSLARALAGSQAVHICLAGGATPLDAGGLEYQAVKRTLEIGKHADWSCVTLQSASWISQANCSQANSSQANSVFGDECAKWRSEEALRWSGLPYAIVRTGLTMEALPRFIHQAKATLAGPCSKPFRLVAAADVARLVARIHGREASGFLGKTLYACGPEPLTLKAALLRYCAAVKPDTRVVTPPSWWLAAKAKWKKDVNLAETLAFLRHLEKVGEEAVQPDGFALAGLQPRNLHAWCREIAAKPKRHSETSIALFPKIGFSI